MELNKNSESKYKKKKSNDLLMKIIDNINEIDTNSTKIQGKRSFSNTMVSLTKKNSNVQELSKKTKLNNIKAIKKEFLSLVDSDKQYESKEELNSLNSNDDERKSNKSGKFPFRKQSRRNFILKSEIYNLNKKEEKKPFNILPEQKNALNSNNKVNIMLNNICSEPIYINDEIKNNPNFIFKEINNISENNLIYNFNQNNLREINKMKNIENNINYNEIKEQKPPKSEENMNNNIYIGNQNTNNSNYDSLIYSNINDINNMNYNSINYNNGNSINNYNYNTNIVSYEYPYSPIYSYYNYYYINNIPPNNEQNLNDNTYFLYQFGKNCSIMNNDHQIKDDRYNDLTKTKSGCQLLKNKIIADPKYANENLLPSIKNSLKDICTNIFGSAMIQTLIQVLTPDNIDLFLSSVKDQILDICQTESGSRVMQTMIEKIKDNNMLINKLILYLKDYDLKKIFKSSYGHHFIKSYLTQIHNKELTNFIYNIIYDNFLEIAKDKFGVCLIQKAFVESDAEDLNKLFKLTEKNIDELFRHCYANFLIQYIFIRIKNRYEFEQVFPLVKKIEEKLVDYCKDKYSSTALEKFFEKGDEKVNEHLIQYLIDFHKDEIIDILIHINGFYVIKKSMNIRNKEIKDNLIKCIVNNINKFELGSKNRSIVSSFCREFSGYSE